MSKVKFVLNRAGVRELLQSAEIQAEVRKYADIVTKNAGEGYANNVQVHHRAVARIYAYTNKAIHDNIKNNTLLKALHK